MIAQPPPKADVVDLFLHLRVGALFRLFAREGVAFWAVCGYLFMEYVRPQSVWPALDILPFAQIFLIVAMVSALIDPKARVSLESTHVWMVAYLAVVVLASQFALKPEISQQNFMKFFGWFVIYFVITAIVRTRVRFLLFLGIFLLASFKLAFHGARTWTMRGFSYASWGLMGPPGPFQNSGELAVQMVVFTAISFAIWLMVWRRSRRLASGCAVIFPLSGAMTVLGASSRGSQLALVAIVLRWLLVNWRRAGVVLGSVLIAVACWVALPEQQRARFTSAGSDETSRQRLLYWQHGVEMIREYPVLGVGFFNFAWYYDRKFSKDVLFGRAQLPHNIFIQVGTDAGLVGLFVYFGLIVNGFVVNADTRRRALRLPRHEILLSVSRGLDDALLGFVIAGQFVTIAYYPFLWIHLALVVSLRQVTRREARLLLKVGNPELPERQARTGIASGRNRLSGTGGLDVAASTTGRDM